MRTLMSSEFLATASQFSVRFKSLRHDEIALEDIYNQIQEFLNFNFIRELNDHSVNGLLHLRLL